MILYMKNLQKGFVPLVAILLVVLGIGIVGGGYFLYEGKHEQKKTETEEGIKNLVNSDDNVKFPSVSSLPLIPIYTGVTKDANNVYFENKIVLNADPATLEVFGGMYMKDKNNVFTYSCFAEGRPQCISILKDADVKTFVPLSNFLAKDSSHVFYHEEIIKDADPNTLVIASHEETSKFKSGLIFLKDKEHVYYVQGLARAEVLPNADPATFEPLSWYYSKDAKNVYFFTDIVLNADPATFELLKEIYYGKDSKNVYSEGKIIQGADAKTFVSIGGGYFKDSKAIYNEKNVVAGVDYETFKPFPPTRFSLDVNHVYVSLNLGKLDIVPSADPATFTAISENYGKDKNFVYFKNRKVLGADPATFRAVTYVGLDKDHYYEFDKVLNSPSESQYGGWEDLGVKVVR